MNPSYFPDFLVNIFIFITILFAAALIAAGVFSIVIAFSLRLRRKFENWLYNERE